MREISSRLWLTALLIATLGVGVGVGHGIGRSRDDPGAERRSRGVSSKRAVLASKLDGQAQRDSLGLPEGVSIDPVTGMLVGASLEAGEGVHVVSWDLLQAYQHTPGLGDLPASIRDLDGKEVLMLGFLLATYDMSEIREFNLVASHWSCCYGVPPGLSGMIYVNLEDDAPGMDLTLSPIRVQGTFRVKELEEHGIIHAIYAIENGQAREVKW